jgi:iron complex transport system ATP-binding protein
MEAMANKNYSNLSGGEKQRVLIARVLAQQPEILILDEPTNHLDIHHQLQIFDLIKSLKLTVLAAIHDLNIAALYCDKIFVIKNGKIYKSGSPEEVLTSQLIYEVYGIQADITVHPITRKISVTYLPAGLHV